MLLIPEYLWSTLLDTFAESRRNVERVAYLDGVRRGDTAVVTTLTIPNARLSAFNYFVSADAAREAGTILRPHGLVRLAQVHTHPNNVVGHSLFDDEHAYAQTAGAISIVLPRHARSRPSPVGLGVHIRELAGWRQVSIEEALGIVQVLPTVFDFRTKLADPPKGRGWWPWNG